MDLGEASTVPNGPVEWDRIAPREPYPGVRSRRFDTAHATVVRYELDPGAEYPLHNHPEEQLVHVLSGSVVFVLGDAELVLAKMDLLHVPGNVPHGASGAGPDTAMFLNVVLPRRSA